jgi:hypothetical protein
VQTVQEKYEYSGRFLLQQKPFAAEANYSHHLLLGVRHEAQILQDHTIVEWFSFCRVHFKLTCLPIAVMYLAAKVDIQLRAKRQGKMDKTLLHFFAPPPSKVYE